MHTASWSNSPHRETPEMLVGIWRAPSERIRTASEIPIEVDLTNVDAIPADIRISEKVIHLRRLGMTYTSISERLGVNVWMAKRATHWGKVYQEKRKGYSH
jgi:hypothetical protein